ncbi:hypothetical protein HYPSUDRAFT_570340 [Hypholoma sublateritium FD-334 SS-4]|uniref:Uncharacterized protein n=1 Tax=Hypholoma sublateritium (strain FD-334 SS-4) TaxID=945553 RepID=A0A0D2L957_HYPSF|nr:hypothetical protein HYPSUDRAFT_570340 [Hypholoma sublateritium FD-334 SS-4]
MGVRTSSPSHCRPSSPAAACRLVHLCPGCRRRQRRPSQVFLKSAEPHALRHPAATACANEEPASDVCRSSMPLVSGSEPGANKK